MVLKTLIFLNFFLNCFTFNIDTNYPIVYEDPSPNVNNKSNYFGYSLVLNPGKRSTKPWILIGAPKGSDASNRNTGVCFKCGIAEPCEMVNINGISRSLSTGYEEKIDEAWIGGSMDINYVSGRIVTCAPRWIKVTRNRFKEVDDYRMQGACYWFHTEDNDTQKLLPLLEQNRDIYTHPNGGGSVYYYAQGQAGFSVHMPLKGREMVLGAPGVYNWDGISILYKDNLETSPVASRLQNTNRRQRYADITEFSYKNIANAIETKQTVAYDLLGYSITSGNFYSKSKLSYVTSAPRSYYKGQILIYNFNDGSEQPLLVKETKHGEQFGEYFGASVTAGDVNNDKLDDLIVGAPFHTTHKFNEGKVYIFLGSRTGRLQVPKRNTIVGKSTNGQFGHTVQFLGDINHDGFGDVAVSAPYEKEKSGVLYLFRGTPDGLDTTFCQRIVGKEVYENIRGFGASISRVADLDFNGYPDLAVGAYLSGHVVLLRSRPVIAINQELTSFVPHLEFKTKSFDMQECFSFKLDQLDPGVISIKRTLTLDQELGRAFLTSNVYDKNIELSPNRKTCFNFTVTLSGSFSNRYDPVTVTLTHTFNSKEETKQLVYVDSKRNGDDMFCPRCPVYSKYDSVYSSTIKIPFALGCKSGNICRSSLSLEPRITDIESNTFVIGSKSYITLKIDVKNSGEKAYLTQVLVTVPNIVTFRSTPSACTEKNSSSVVCSVDNPLETDAQKSVVLDLDMSTINTGKYDNSFIIKVEGITSSENDGDKVKELEVKLNREADVTITGKSGEQSYFYRNITEGKPNFTQIYQVEKFGSSPLGEVSIEINIPHIFLLDDGTNVTFTGLFPLIATLGDQDVFCTTDFTYLVEKQSTYSDSEILEDSQIKEPLKRSVRQVEVFNKTSTRKFEKLEENDFEIYQNRTYYINCTMEEIVCSKVMCSAGPLRSGQVVKIRIPLLFDIASIQSLLRKRDVILFASRGRVTVTNPSGFVQNGDKPDSVDVVSVFIGGSRGEDIALWIIIASAVAGLLLLVLLTFALIKAGFFKRTTKEELEQLKKEMEFQEDLQEEPLDQTDE